MQKDVHVVANNWPVLTNPDVRHLRPVSACVIAGKVQELPDGVFAPVPPVTFVTEIGSEHGLGNPEGR